jgi:hypothetical protein
MRKKSLSVVQAGFPLLRALPTKNEAAHTQGHIDCPASERVITPRRPTVLRGSEPVNGIR